MSFTLGLKMPIGTGTLDEQRSRARWRGDVTVLTPTELSDQDSSRRHIMMLVAWIATWRAADTSRNPSFSRTRREATFQSHTLAQFVHTNRLRIVDHGVGGLGREAMPVVSTEQLEGELGALIA